MFCYQNKRLAIQGKFLVLLNVFTLRLTQQLSLVIQNPLVPSPLLFSGSSHWFQVQRKIIRKLKKKKKKKCTWKKNLMVSTLKAIRENGSTFLNSYFKWIFELRTKEVCTFGSDFHRRGVWTYLILWGPLMLPFLRCPSLFLTIKKLHSLLHIYSLRR